MYYTPQYLIKANYSARAFTSWYFAGKRTVPMPPLLFLMFGDERGQQIELGLLGESEFAAVFGNFTARAIFVH